MKFWKYGALAVLMAGFVYFTYSKLSRSPGQENSGQELQWKRFDDGIALAKQTNKKVLVDVYTDWCGWCKKMDKEVYADPAVRNILSGSFVVVKLNAESSKPVRFNGEAMTEAQFSESAGVTGYPTTLFLTSDGKPITSLPGYVKADKMVDILDYIAGEHYKSGSFQDYLSTHKR